MRKNQNVITALFTIVCFSLMMINSYSQSYAITETGYRLAVKIENNQGNGQGSGFFYQDSTSYYLVTAKHVLLKLNEKDKKFEPKLDNLIVKYYNKNDTLFSSYLKINFNQVFQVSNNVKYNETDDIVAVKIGTIDFVNNIIKFTEGCTNITTSMRKFDPASITKKWNRRFDDVLYGSDVWIMGYPESLNLVKLDLYDFDSPLLRKGVVAGKYQKKGTLVIDCPSYPGNSGGPVFNRQDRRDFSIIGVVVAFIPYAEYWRNLQYKITNKEYANSGYTIVVPMDKIIKLLEE